ncbi:MAG: hypothetical protein AAGA76_06345 [Pseudomonadota bacterium]
MKNIFGILVLSVAVALPASLVFGAAPFVKSAPEVKTQNDVIPVGKLRHRHRHCHIVFTFGHAKKRCHTHRHNKVAHHGPTYH